MAMDEKERMEQIEEILSKLEETWKESHSLRFCQLIDNVLCNLDKDIFYVEDDEFEKRLKKFKKWQENPSERYDLIEKMEQDNG